MERHHSRKGRQRWLVIAIAAVITVGLGIWVNSIFLLLVTMVFMHTFGHVGGQHSGKPGQSSERDNRQDEEEQRVGCH